MKTARKRSNNPQKKRKFCLEQECRTEASAHGYCRLHYIANWRHIKFYEKVKAERRLNAYVDRIAKKYPKDFLEKIREGLESEDKFRQSVQELDLNAEPEQPQEESEREFLERFLRDIKVDTE